jgi:hypothetical protein
MFVSACFLPHVSLSYVFPQMPDHVFLFQYFSDRLPSIKAHLSNGDFRTISHSSSSHITSCGCAADCKSHTSAWCYLI